MYNYIHINIIVIAYCDIYIYTHHILYDIFIRSYIPVRLMWWRDPLLTLTSVPTCTPGCTKSKRITAPCQPSGNDI